MAADFWTVKNVTGRILVGLRWANEIEEDGTEKWTFESRDTFESTRTDNLVFWTGLYVAPLVWIFFAIFAFFRIFTNL